MTSPQDNRIFHFPPWGPGEPIESYRHRKRLAFDTWSAQRSAMLARTDSAGRPLYRVTSGGNIVRTKPITKRLKKRILTRDGNRCVECGSTKWLEIAHIEPYRISGNNADDNLRTLCNPCHQAEGRNAVLSH